LSIVARFKDLDSHASPPSGINRSNSIEDKIFEDKTFEDKRHSMATEFRLHDAPMAADRAEGWRFVRNEGDVFLGDNDVWFLTSPEAVQFAHRNPKIFSSAKAFDFLMSPVPMIPIAVDPPDHKRFRRILDPMLAPRVIDAMQDDLRLQVRDLISKFADKGECDVVQDLARLYPTQVFLTLFGMPISDRDRFMGWVETMVEGGSANADEPEPEMVQAATGLFGYLQGFIVEKRQNPGDDMLSRVLALEGEDAWSDEEVLGLCFLFTLAGLDTVTAAIGFMMLHLAKHPELRQQVREDDSAIDRVIDEVLRLELPAPTTPRITTQEVEVCGQTIPAGAHVMLCLATVNRDPQRFPAGDEIDLDPANRGHLSFGGGIHRCLGSHLARRELRLVIEEFHKAIPEYQIAPGVEPEIVWPSGTLHLSSLPLEFPKR
jgi:cytochrome P450